LSSTGWNMAVAFLISEGASARPWLVGEFCRCDEQRIHGLPHLDAFLREYPFILEEYEQMLVQRQQVQLAIPASGRLHPRQAEIPRPEIGAGQDQIAQRVSRI